MVNPLYVVAAIPIVYKSAEQIWEALRGGFEDRRGAFTQQFTFNFLRDNPDIKCVAICSNECSANGNSYQEDIQFWHGPIHIWYRIYGWREGDNGLFEKQGDGGYQNWCIRGQYDGISKRRFQI